MDFKWDGSEVGEISTFVLSQTRTLKHLILHLKDGSRTYITKNYGTIPLICDELKTIFKLDKIGRHTCNFYGKSCIIHRILGEEYSLSDTVLNPPVDEIKRVIIFRWVMGLSQNYESSILIRKFKTGICHATSYIESKYNYMSSLGNGSGLNKQMLIRWFGSTEQFKVFIEELFGDATYSELYDHIRKIILRIDAKHGLWITSIMSRISQYLQN